MTLIKKLALISACLFALGFYGAGCNPFSKDAEPAAQEEQQALDTASTTKEDANYGDSQMAEDTALSNPATVYCLSQDGKFIMKKTLAGSSEGYCELPDKTECEVWALYKGECGKDAVKTKEGEPMSTSTEMIEPEANSTSTAITPNEGSMSSGSNEAVSGFDAVTTDSKKKITGDIDIAAKPGEETGEIIMSWDTHDLSAPEGYIVMLSGSDKVTFPSKYSHKLENPDSYAFTWVDLNPEREYFLRVCIRKGDSCGTYSPIISIYPQNLDSNP